MIAGWSSLVARRAHNPEVVGSNPTPATKLWLLKPHYLLKLLWNAFAPTCSVVKMRSYKRVRVRTSDTLISQN